MIPGFFVTGTDTDVGKTFVSVQMINYFVQQGLRVAGMKPIASGAIQTSEGWQNEDAQQLIDASNVELPYQQVNPYLFHPPIAPSIASKQVNQQISLQKIQQYYQAVQQQADVTLVEAVGGWKVPVNDHETVCDMAVKLQLPVILVVGLQLGCINHAILTEQAIIQSGMKLLGWIANEAKPQQGFNVDDNVTELRHYLSSSCLKVIRYQQQNIDFLNCF
ncbi:MAG: dethiobiotin synthase [Methylococcales bacterium]|jgi:dethiobiotin synthetase|nr:dethiobiotin synthase [Methylococcales bacterium]MBT7409321.1 dethiobiotin synthase [Methylococcales bacterium]